MLFRVALVVALVFSLVGCSDSDSQGDGRHDVADAIAKDVADKPDSADVADESDTTDVADESDTTDVTGESDTTDAVDEPDTTDAVDESDTTDAFVEPDAMDTVDEPDTTDAMDESDTTDVNDEPDAIEDTVEPDPCDPNPCQNDGECTASGEVFICTCRLDWTGNTCEECGTQCSTRPDYYRDRFLLCYRDTDFCDRLNTTCEEYCSGWMACVGELDINSDGVASVTGPEGICL